jgi:hypothetical protein
VTWRSSNYNFLSAAGSGLFTGHKTGTATVIAEKPLFSRYLPVGYVIIMPPDTYVLAGQVIESRDPLTFVDGATVTVTRGVGEGQAAGTGGQGYRLYGLSGPITLRVIKDGYRTEERTVTVTDHQLFDIDLPLVAPRPDLSGTFTLTVTAADECGVGRGDGHLLEEARERRYTALVTQNGPLVDVELSGEAFVAPMPEDHRFTGRIEPGRALFDLTWWDAWWDFGPPRIVEQLTTGETWLVNASVVATVSPRGLVGTLNGDLVVYPAGVKPEVRAATAARCTSTRHQFAMSR